MNVPRKDHDHKAQVMGTNTATTISIRMVASANRYVIAIRARMVSSIVISIGGAVTQ